MTAVVILGMTGIDAAAALLAAITLGGMLTMLASLPGALLWLPVRE
jgi:hypothetical protein